MTEVKGTGVSAEVRGSIVNVEKVSVDIDAKGFGRQAARIMDAFARFGFPRRYVEAQRVKAIADAQSAVIRAEGDAQARKIEAQATVDEALILEDGARALFARMIQRFGQREFLRQVNLEAIEYKAVESAPDSGSDEPVSDDFMAHFIEQSQDSTEEWIRDKWARILVGEFEKPGSFSPRTLHAVKMMRKDDADLFTRYCQFVWDATESGPGFAVISDGEDSFWAPERAKLVRQSYDRAGISPLRRMQLQDLNLITLKDSNLALNIRSHMGLPGQITYHGQRYWVRRSDDSKLQLPVDFLTDIGRELAPIADAPRNADYERLVLEQISGRGFEVCTSYPGRDVAPSAT